MSEETEKSTVRKPKVQSFFKNHRLLLISMIIPEIPEIQIFKLQVHYHYHGSAAQEMKEVPPNTHCINMYIIVAIINYNV